MADYRSLGYSKFLTRELTISTMMSSLEARSFAPTGSINASTLDADQLSAITSSTGTLTVDESITAGGSVNGVIYVKDSSANTKVQLDNTGIIVSDGRISVPYLELNNWINDDDSTIEYTGTWTQENVSVLMNGTRTKSSTVGDSFEITFTGTAIGLIFERATNLGKVTISIDGDLIGTLDLYSTILLARSVAYQTSSLEYGEHTLTGVIATKNESSSGNAVGLQGYTLFPNEGIKLPQLSADLITYGTSLETDANGYATTSLATIAGYAVYHIVGVRLDEEIMADATATDPKICWRQNELYLYNGAAAITYSLAVTVMVSKI